MKKNIKDVLIIELLILIYIVMLKIIVIDNYSYLLNFVNVFFWGILAVFMYLVFGFFKDKHYLKNISIRYMIIFLLCYLIFTYLLGLFTGFTSTVFSLNFSNILKNVFFAVVLVISKEFVRYVVCKRVGNNIQLVVVLTVLYIIFDIIMSINVYNFKSFEQIFMFMFIILIPSIAKQSLCTYITYNISLIPTIMYVLSFEICAYIFPIFPDLGNYIVSVLGLLFPFIIYSKMSEFLRYNKKKNINYRRDFARYIFIPISCFVAVIVLLVSGLFSYKMVAIGSDSMNPIYYRGDAIIYKKVDPHDVEEKDILVFEHNEIVVTHRVQNVIKKDNVFYFQTKGDNNKDVDTFIVNEEEVLGVVKYIVKYVGYPTIWFNDLF